MDKKKGGAFDGCDYARALESMYNVSVVMELALSGPTAHAPWKVVAKAYDIRDGVVAGVSTNRTVTYPSRWVTTFDSAVMQALYALEESLRASAALRGMNYT